MGRFLVACFADSLDGRRRTRLLDMGPTPVAPLPLPRDTEQHTQRQHTFAVDIVDSIVVGTADRLLLLPRHLDPDW